MKKCDVGGFDFFTGILEDFRTREQMAIEGSPREKIVKLYDAGWKIVTNITGAEFLVEREVDEEQSGNSGDLDETKSEQCCSCRCNNSA